MKLSRPVALRASLAGILLVLAGHWTARGETPSTTHSVDVCIYCATPAGIVAAVTAKQEGRSVLVVEPGRWLGGILGAGIKPMEDCAEPRAVGGLTRSKVFKLGDNPPAIRAAFAAWLRAEQVPVLFEHRIVGVEKEGPRIARIRLEYAPPDAWGVPAPTAAAGPARTVEARVFIDAGYEGDLMARAGVRYAVGREPADKFHEKPAGVGDPTNWTPLDPYVRPGDPRSGLLPLVDPDHGKPKGAGDDYTQAYNFRYYATTDPAKRAALTPPDDYDPRQFELVGRYVEYIIRESAGNSQRMMTWLAHIFPGWMNAGEYNYFRESLISMAPLGVSRYYQDGNWPARARVWRQHIDYLRGLHHFLSTDSRVPEAFRRQTAAWGLDKTMHPDTQGWPNQLYVRIARRMTGRYILTHADVLNKTQVDDSVGFALYGVDTYPARRYAAVDPRTGKLGVATEGNMFLGGARGTKIPYAIPYRALTPKAEECSNLLVPVCFSASYVAYASARMEPVFSLLGESAGVAAAQAVRQSSSVQSLDVDKLQDRLKQRGQILKWAPER
jgi:hypothetical protein